MGTKDIVLLGILVIVLHQKQVLINITRVWFSFSDMPCTTSEKYCKTRNKRKLYLIRLYPKGVKLATFLISNKS